MEHRIEQFFNEETDDVEIVPDYDISHMVVPGKQAQLIELPQAFLFNEGQQKLLSAAKYLWKRWSTAPIHEADINDKLAYDLLRWLVSAPDIKVETDGTFEVANELDQLV